MRHPQPLADPARSNFASDPREDRMADGTRRVPAWNRERLIDQFQRIDGSTRIEAERQIADFERSFGSASADRSNPGIAGHG